MKNSTTEFAPKSATHPGTMLQRELDARDIKQSDLAGELGIAASQLNEVIKGKRPIGPELAILLEAALEIEAEYWNTSQANYNLDLARKQAAVTKQADAITQWHTIKELVPLKYFKKQGLLTGSLTEDISRVFEVFRINSVNELQRSLAVGGVEVLYKKSGKLKTHVEHMKAWVAYVRYLSDHLKVNAFEFGAEQDLINRLRKVFLGRDVLSHLSTTLCSHGIKLVIRDKPDHAPIDGAALWSKDDCPVIGLTLRHHRLDNLAFTVYHELGHILLHLRGNRKVSFVDNTVEDTKGINSDAEKEANDFASNILIPDANWNEFIRSNTSFDDSSIKRFAASISTPAASVRGRLCYEGLLSWAKPTKIDNHIL
jgi:HTH-type transcriptional regulator/antitoxin HigA